MFNLQGSEIIIILLLALVVLGPEKLPDAIRKFSQTYGELRKMGTGFQSELKSALDEPMREIRNTADMVQHAADPKRVMEEAENEARLRAEADAASAAGITDVPVDPAAEEVLDPAASSVASSIDATSANGESPRVNQIAASMARGPIDVAPADVVTPQPSEVDDRESRARRVTEDQPSGLAPPSGAAAHFPPPSAHAASIDTDEPPSAVGAGS